MAAGWWRTVLRQTFASAPGHTDCCTASGWNHSPESRLGSRPLGTFGRIWQKSRPLYGARVHGGAARAHLPEAQPGEEPGRQLTAADREAGHARVAHDPPAGRH